MFTKPVVETLEQIERGLAEMLYWGYVSGDRVQPEFSALTAEEQERWMRAAKASAIYSTYLQTMEAVPPPSFLRRARMALCFSIDAAHPILSGRNLFQALMAKVPKRIAIEFPAQAE